jgi:hypothetical protein
MNYSLCVEVVRYVLADVFTTTIRSESQYCCAILFFDPSNIVLDGILCVFFLFYEIYPSKAGVIIDEGHIVLSFSLRLYTELSR